MLDRRLDGGDTRDLCGQPGLKGRYARKESVERLKRAVTTFAGSDPDLSGQIEKALALKQTLLGRFAGSRA